MPVKQAGTDVVPKLSKRQRQILGLLQQGKVNKEVASELGIELGTVKQHIVAIFKKLNVSNRAMAVSRSMAQDEKASLSESLASEIAAGGHIEKRPVVVLSLAVDTGGQPAEGTSQALLGVMGSAAAAARAIFLTRQEDGGDILFNIQKASMWSVVHAIRTAQRVYGEIMARIPGMEDRMHASICAGLALASMRRFGGWSEEMLASSVITGARQHLREMPPRFLYMDDAALELLAACELEMVRTGESTGNSFDIARLDVRPCPSPERPLLAGRNRERQMLSRALKGGEEGRGECWFVEGDTGMGKTALTHWLLNQAPAFGLPCRHLRFTPEALGGPVYDFATRGYTAFQELKAILVPGGKAWERGVILLEDVHWLDKELRPELLDICMQMVRSGKIVVLTGRRGAIPQPLFKGRWLKLERLTAADAGDLVRGAAPHLSPVEQAAIVREGAGVPLFLSGLARNAHMPDIPLTLLLTVAARLDPLRLDRVLLRQVAQAESRPGPDAFAPDSLERAADLKILKVGRDGEVDFVHPFVRRVVIRLMLHIC